MVDTTLVVMGSVGVGCAAGVFAWAGRSGRALRRHLATRAQHLAGMPEGVEAGFHGTVRCEAPLQDPVVGRPCVYCRTVLCGSDGGDGGWRPHPGAAPNVIHETVERAADWALEDETGSVRVDGNACDVVGCGYEEAQPGEVARWHAADAGHAAGHSSLLVGRRVVVAGRVAHRGADTWLVGPSLRADGRAPEERLGSGRLATILSVLLALGGLALAGAGVAAPSEPEPPPVREGPLQPQPQAR